MPVTPLAAAFDAQRKDGVLARHLMKASTQIYKGSLLAVDSAGKLKPWGDAASEKFAGVAYESNLSAASGNYYARAVRHGTFLVTWYDDDAAAQADLYTEVYAVSDAEVSPNASGSGATKKASQDIKCGRIVEIVSTTQVRIAIDNYC